MGEIHDYIHLKQIRVYLNGSVVYIQMFTTLYQRCLDPYNSLNPLDFIYHLAYSRLLGRFVHLYV